MSKQILTGQKMLSPEEQSNLLSLLQKYPSRDSTLIELALQTGARAQELLNLHIDDIDLINNLLHIKSLKGSHQRLIPVQPKLLQKVHSLAMQAPSKKPFPISYKRLFQIWGDYRPNKKKFHSLRHTFAVNLFRRSKNLRLVQKALGHKWIKNTEIYLDFEFSHQELAQAMGL